MGVSRQRQATARSRLGFMLHTPGAPCLRCDVVEKQNSASGSESESGSKRRATVFVGGWAYIVVVLTKLGQRGSTIQEDMGDYFSRNDSDTDADPDSEKNRAAKSPTIRASPCRAAVAIAFARHRPGMAALSVRL